MLTTKRNALIGFVFAGIAALASVIPSATAPAGEDTAKAKAKDGEVKLVPVEWQGYLDQVASKKDTKAKLIVVDAWATWCGPCMKNFPHLVEMHAKYADKGLVAMSLSLDEFDKPKKVEAATAFLKEKKATFTNLIFEAQAEEAFEKLNIGAIPAVFLYTPDGKELKRFTLDDVDKLFTYEQVEAYVKDYLDGKSPK